DGRRRRVAAGRVAEALRGHRRNIAVPLQIRGGCRGRLRTLGGPFPKMLIARDLVIEAGIRTLIRDASFSVQAGDKIGLVGRNGAGKTTLMRTLHGELEPAGGVILRSGRIGYFSQE